MYFYRYIFTYVYNIPLQELITLSKACWHCFSNIHIIRGWCCALTSQHCDSPKWACSVGRRAQADHPLRSAGCTPAVGWCSHAPRELLLGEMEPAARSLQTGTQTAKVLRGFCFVCLFFLVERHSEWKNSVKTEKEKQCTCVWGRYNRVPVSVSVTGAADSLRCSKRVSGRRSVAVTDSDTKTDFWESL